MREGGRVLTQTRTSQMTSALYPGAIKETGNLSPDPADFEKPQGRSLPLAAPSQRLQMGSEDTRRLRRRCKCQEWKGPWRFFF